MRYTEEASLFPCAGETQAGIIAIPETPKDTAVVVIVGGPQYRVGSHRQFLLLSRTLATAGFAVLRFDYRGMGDSEGIKRDFQEVSTDVSAAVDALQARLPHVTRVALWGLCDGASAALLYCQEIADPRVAGLCLVNPWVRSETSLARTQLKHYYTKRLMQKEFWYKLLCGRVAAEALAGLIGNFRTARGRADASVTDAAGTVRLAPFQQRMAKGWAGFKGPILLVLAEDDYTAKEFLECSAASPEWRKNLLRSDLTRHDVPNVDHTFSSAASRKVAESLTLNWLVGQFAVPLSSNNSHAK